MLCAILPRMWGDVLNQLPWKRRASKFARAATAMPAMNASSKSQARRPNRTLKHFGTILVILLLAFVAALSWQAWRQEEADSKAELATVAEVGARALDSYLNQLEISLKILAEALSEN